MSEQICNSKAKKARKKWVTQRINSPLIELNSSLKKYYGRAYGCSSVLYQEGKSVSTRYCNCRTCLTCNGIRTYLYIKHYSDQILSFREPQFVTLTAPTIWSLDSENLKLEIGSREASWRKIYDNSKKSYNGSINLKGLKAMEVTARPDEFYHIHFHFILDGLFNAEWLKVQWLRLYPNSKHYLQVIKPVTSEGGLLEVFKYGTKFFDIEKVTIDGKEVERYSKVEPRRTDTIMQALRSKRLISTFGGIRRLLDDDINKIVEKVSISELAEIEYRIWRWVNDNDWFADDTGEKFSSFEPSDSLLQSTC